MRSPVTILARTEAIYPSDVLLFHPDDPSIFVVGTYLLDEATSQRHGKICIYRLVDSDSQVSPAENVSLVNEVDCDAVLDMKWYGGRLYVAHSTGSLSVYEYNQSSTDVKLELLLQKTVLNAEVLIMSLSVTVRGIMTSHSDGTMAVWTDDLQTISSWKVSDLEVWIQSWGKDEHTVYSGSDDGVFAAWDMRTPGQDSASSVFANRRTHGAGVTAILPYGSDHHILTGSYDDKMRRFDLRNPQRSFEEGNLGGGVWRIIPTGQQELLTCCMYDGAKIIKDDSFDIVKRFDAHESIVYGGDVAGDVFGTCSFYDKSIYIWQ